MTLEELGAQFNSNELTYRWPTTWKLLRVSRAGNHILEGVNIVGLDPIPGLYAGWAYPTYVRAVVDPETNQVLHHTVDCDEPYDY